MLSCFLLGLTIYLFQNGSIDSSGSGDLDGSEDLDSSGNSDGSGDSDSSDDVCFHFSRLWNKIERTLKNRGYAANCRVKRETEEKTLEKRNDKLKLVIF